VIFSSGFFIGSTLGLSSIALFLFGLSSLGCVFGVGVIIGSFSGVGAEFEAGADAAGGVFSDSMFDDNVANAERDTKEASKVLGAGGSSGTNCWEKIINSNSMPKCIVIDSTKGFFR
jgi:hypothetical protein